MSQSVGIIGGADGPTAVFVTDSISAQRILLPILSSVLFAVVLYAALYRRGKAKALCLGAFGLLVIAADQAVKLLTKTLALGETASFLPGLIQLRRVNNYGAAWSSFSGARWLLIAATSIGMGFLVWLLAKIVRHPLGQWSITAVIAGGVGNLIDRAAQGYVTDMFDLLFMSYPVFNVADCFIVCGTIAAMVYYLVLYPKTDERKWKDRHGNGGSDGN